MRLKGSVSVLTAVLLLTGLTGHELSAQGFLRSDSHSSHRLQPTKQDISVSINGKEAQVSAQHLFNNQASGSKLVRFYFLLSDNMIPAQRSLMVNDRLLKGRILTYDSSPDSYEALLKSEQDPGLLQILSKRLFQSDPFLLPASGMARVSFQYSEHLPVKNGLCQLRYSLSGLTGGTERMNRQLLYSALDAEPQSMSDGLTDFDPAYAQTIRVTIKQAAPVRNIYSPTHSVTVDYLANQSVVVTWEGHRKLINEEFVLYFAHEEGEFGMNAIAYHAGDDSDGYFALLASTDGTMPQSMLLSQDIIFVVDVSGSMSGQKLEQVQNALISCIERLKDEDYFNIVAFSDESKIFQMRLVSAAEFRNTAVDFVAGLQVSGGSNINESILTALNMRGSENRSRHIILITDGRPTIGVVDTEEIVSNLRRFNVRHYRIHTLGIGNKVNTELLDRIAYESRGAAQYFESNDDDIQRSILGYVDSIRNPALTSVRIDYGDLEVYDVFPKRVPDIYVGAPLMLVGRYKGASETTITCTGESAGGRVSFESRHSFPMVETDNDYLARLWAKRRIGDLLAEMKLDAETNALRRNIVKSSKQFGIMTPYASLMPNHDDVFFAYGSEKLSAKAVRNFDGVASIAPLLEQKTGQASVAYSRGARRLQDVDKINLLDAAQIRYLQRSTFVFGEDGYWTDSEFEPSAFAMHIEFNSPEYYRWLRKNPETAQTLCLGKRVRFKHQDKSIVVDSTGDAKLPGSKMDERKN